MPTYNTAEIVVGSNRRDHAPWRELPELGARGQFHLKRGSFARSRVHPDPAAMHLDYLLGDGETKARAALGLGE